MSTPWIVALSLTWIAVGMSMVVTTGFMRRVLPQLERIEQILATPEGPPAGLPVGSRAPAFAARTRAGTLVQSDDFSGTPWLALFMSGHCRPCVALASQLTELHEGPARVVVVVDSADDQETLGIPDGVMTLIQSNHSVAEAFESLATPHAFAISPTGVITGAAFPKNGTELVDMVAMAAGSRKEDRDAAVRGRRLAPVNDRAVVRSNT